MLGTEDKERDGLGSALLYPFQEVGVHLFVGITADGMRSLCRALLGEI